MGTIVINGEIYLGNSITVKNGKVIVDGKDFTPNSKDIKIEVKGDIDRLDVGSCKSLKVNGNINNVSTQSGDVSCGHVSGNVSTMSGDVDCMNVGKSVSTMSGDIKYKK